MVNEITVERDVALIDFVANFRRIYESIGAWL